MPTSRTGTRVERSGFTLIELLVVLVALVVLAAAVVPALRGAGHQENLDAATARVAASARFARETAASRGVTVTLTAETEPSMIRLAIDENEATPAAGLPVGRAGQGDAPSPLLPARFAQVFLPAGVTAQLEEAPDDSSNRSAGTIDGLRFPPDGPGPGGVIVLSDARGRERRILVTPGTSQVITSG
jgi:type II secretion system protein H